MIPLFRPSCSEKEIQYVTETLRSGWWGQGDKVNIFEKMFAEFVGTRYAVAVNSATAALHLSLKVHDIYENEIIVPALTFISTALVGLYEKCTIVFADIDEKTLCLDWKDVKSKITTKTKAIIPVWYGGYVSHPDIPLKPLIIEDCSHAVGNKKA